jgi:hypothetical protein
LIRSTISFLAFVVLYVLSIGPMFWYWYEATYLGGPRWIVAFYEPLRLATRFCFFEDLINDYINWWIL